MDALIERDRKELETLQGRAQQITKDAVAEGRDLTEADELGLAECTERMKQLGNKIEAYVKANDEANRTAGLIAQIHHDGEDALIRAEAPQALTELYGGPLGAARYVSDLYRSTEDSAAAERIQRAVANVVTTSDSGRIPDPLVGDLIDVGVDARMPLVQSVGPQPLGGRGPIFYRRRIAQHTQVGVQVKGGGVQAASAGAEKTELASRAFQTERVPVEVSTLGGVVDVSRQDIDFSDVDSINGIIVDLTKMANQQAETILGTSIATDAAANATTAPAALDAASFHAGLWEGVGRVLTAVDMLPTHVAMSSDVFVTIGGWTDSDGRPIYASLNPRNADTTLRADQYPSDPFAGLTPLVSPALPAKTVVVYHAPLIEAWEQEIGVLTVTEPRLLGQEVAYGRYWADLVDAPGASAQVTLP